MGLNHMGGEGELYTRPNHIV